MNRCLWSALSLLLLVPAFVSAQEPQPVRLSRPEVMKQKLESSQKVLAALALEDFDAVAANAQRLSLLTLEASWHVLQTPEYRRESDEFRRTADLLTTAARNKNLDGATLAYMQATMKCVQCHKYLRTTDR
jgi:cytochrome c556